MLTPNDDYDWDFDRKAEEAEIRAAYINIELMLNKQNNVSILLL